MHVLNFSLIFEEKTHSQLIRGLAYIWKYTLVHLINLLFLDIIPIPLVEIEDQEEEKEDGSTQLDNELVPQKITKEPALIPYVFEDDGEDYDEDDEEEGGNKYSWKVSVWSKVEFCCLSYIILCVFSFYYFSFPYIFHVGL